MQAGFGKRLMLGSDQMYWPEGITMAVDAVEKRDIFYGKAVRFYPLS